MFGNNKWCDEAKSSTQGNMDQVRAFPPINYESSFNFSCNLYNNVYKILSKNNFTVEPRLYFGLTIRRVGWRDVQW